MSKLFMLIISCSCWNNMFSQAVKKFPIGDSGCSAYFFCTPPDFALSYSDDSSKVYTGSCMAIDSTTYGVICIKLKEKVMDIQQAEDLTVSYLDYLKTNFDISSAAGYGKGHRLEGKENTRGIIDYWKDKTGDDWKIKAWTDGKYIGVLYVYVKGTLYETGRTNVFLDGFRLPTVK